MHRWFFLLAAFFYFPLAIAADEPVAAAAGSHSVASNSASMANSLLVVTLALLFVIAVIFVAAWFLRRFGGPGLSGSQSMKILSVLPVGPREKVMLIEVAGKQLLLGVAPGSVNRLHEFEEPVVEIGQIASSSDFANKMKQFLRTDK